MSSQISLSFFDEGSPYLHHPLLNSERTKAEVDFVSNILNLAPGARILDVGCGFGRHTIEFARRGYQAVGVDPSEALIASARQRASSAGVKATFIQLPAERFKTVSHFDAAICLFTTLGQVNEQGKSNISLLRSTNAVLKPVGSFIVEVPQRDPYLEQLKLTDEYGDEISYTSIIRHYNSTNKVVNEIFKVVTPESVKTYELRYKLFSKQELSDLLRQAGFHVEAGYANYDGSPLRTDSPFMLFVSSKNQ